MTGVGRAVASALVVVSLGGFAVGCDPQRPAGSPGNPRVVVLGFDGIDPRLVERGLAAGRLPNLARLSERGSFRRLATTTPPQSPVTWSTFSTGLSPGRHGVFGLVGRDPATYAVRELPVAIDPPRLLVGIPLRGFRADSGRHGDTFWQIADRHGVASVILRVPYDLPPEALAHGRVLSGLGVPDARGTTSSFTLLTTAAAPDGAVAGGSSVAVRWEGDHAAAQLDGALIGGQRFDPLPVELRRAGNGRLDVKVGSERLRLGVGEWSELVPLRFALSPFYAVDAVVRVYLEALEPELRLYVSSPGFDPRAPRLELTAPPSFAADVARNLGLFQTVGWAEPTFALEAGALDEVGFLGEVASSLAFARRLTLHEIDQRDAELVVSVFTETDRVAHMFHRYTDPHSPLYTPAGAERFGEVIDRGYDAMDEIVGDVQAHLPAAAHLIVLSGHGFHAFDHEVDLNAWLAREGWMKRSDGGDLSGVDWGRTQAYAVGVGSVYLNLRGREGQGIVAPGAEAETLLAAIGARLLALRDPATDAAVVAGVRRGAEAFAGPYAEQAPDLIVVFADGYRSSFASARGGAAEQVVAANLHRWSGDHSASDAALTPGILITDFAVASESPALADIAPTVLGLLGVPVPAGLDGKALQ